MPISGLIKPSKVHFGKGMFRVGAVSTAALEEDLKNIGRLIPGAALANAMLEGAEVIAAEARRKVYQVLTRRSGDLGKAIKAVKVSQYRADVRVDSPYGAAHEFGVTVRITPKQRRFFWAMYMTKKDPMWLALALSVTYTIPPRPYVRPSIDSHKKKAVQVIALALADELKEAI